MNRLLILSASAGAGHTRAAQAVEAACRRRSPGLEVRHVDTLSLTPVAFRRAYGDAYLDLVNRAPELLGVFYDRTNRPPRSRTGDRLRLVVERLSSRPLVGLLEEFQPDVICHTHFLAAEILAHRRRRRHLTTPQAIVVTDFDVHRFWLTPGVTRYFVAREENRVHLTTLGEPADSIQVTGIPIHPVFADARDGPSLRRKHGVTEGVPLVLVLGGGFGVGPVASLLESLWASVRGAQLVVVAGRNKRLHSKLEAQSRTAPVPTRVLGFTDEMHEWMSMADLCVTKPGGLTTAEALACGLPMVVANPIPGQETRNATMLYESGAAICGENPHTLGYRVSQLVTSPERLAAMRRAARALGRPRAALEVAEALAHLG